MRGARLDASEEEIEHPAEKQRMLETFDHLFPAAEWRAFLTGVREDEFDTDR